MLKLKKLKITNDEPLCIDFLGKIKKKIEVKDKEKIKNILFYFFENCDEGKSPQSLWETSKGLGYKSLLIDYKDDPEKFDNICDYLLAILSKNLEVERQYIASIEVAYPDNWNVVYESSK